MQVGNLRCSQIILKTTQTNDVSRRTEFRRVRGKIMFRKIFSLALASLLLVVSVAVSFAKTNVNGVDAVRVQEPLNIAILIQDDLTSRVGNELGVTREFIRALPSGSRVMVGYITSGSLQVRQPFTTDLEK